MYKKIALRDDMFWWEHRRKAPNRLIRRNADNHLQQNPDEGEANEGDLTIHFLEHLF